MPHNALALCLFSIHGPTRKEKEAPLMINKVILVGRLGRDPEMHYTPQGTTVTTFPVATERSWKDESGADHKETTWHSIVTL